MTIPEIPVLVTLFNRADVVAETVRALEKVHPRRLFLAADGPRPDRPGEAEKCAAARAAALEAVTWECEVVRWFQESNLGCGPHMTAAITRFFAEVEEGVILEDDCVASPDFFRFCAALLERYRTDERVMMIGGSALVRPASSEADYYFSSFPVCWGWATWRRAWRRMDYELADFPAFVRSGKMVSLFPGERRMRNRLLELFGKVRSHAPGFDTWDFQWLFAVVASGGLCVLPTANLVANIGWDSMHRRIDAIMELPVEPLGEVIRHPVEVRRDVRMEKRFFDTVYAKPPLWRRGVEKIFRLFQG